MKCPECSCDTGEDNGYCDMCGAPFGKKQQAEAQAAEEIRQAKKAAERVEKRPVKTEGKVPISPEVMAKVLAAGGKKAEKKGPVEIPPEFIGLDTGGKVNPFPETGRKLAWALLAIVMIWIFVAIVWMFANQDKIAAGLNK